MINITPELITRICERCGYKEGASSPRKMVKEVFRVYNQILAGWENGSEIRQWEFSYQDSIIAIIETGIECGGHMKDGDDDKLRKKLEELKNLIKFIESNAYEKGFVHGGENKQKELSEKLEKYQKAYDRGKAAGKRMMLISENYANVKELEDFWYEKGFHEGLLKSEDIAR